MRRGFFDNYPVTSVLLIVNVGLFLIEALATRRFDNTGNASLFSPVHWEVLVNLGGLSPKWFVAGEYWRAIMCNYLHADALHLGLNMLALWNIGPFCEGRFSSPKYFSMYTLAGVGGSIGSLVWRRVATGVPLTLQVGPAIGASGAIAGLIGAMLVYSIRNDQEALRSYLTRWLIAMAVFSFVVPHLDHGGHIGGFLVGAALGATVRGPTSSTTVRRWLVPSYVLGTLAAASIATSIYLFYQRS